MNTGGEARGSPAHRPLSHDRQDRVDSGWQRIRAFLGEYRPASLSCRGAGPGELDEQAAILLYLAQFAPLAIVAHSGSKSLHGWFFCQGQSEERLRAFMRHAVIFGADPVTWTRNQFVRLPGGTRDNGNQQTVFYINPGVIKC